MEQSKIRKILEQYTVRELQVLAEVAGVRGRTRLTKAALITELAERGYRPRGDTEEPRVRKVAKNRLIKIVQGLSAARTLTADRLSIIPFKAEDAASSVTSLFEEIDAGTVEVREVEGGGSVPELRVTKTSTGRTLLLEGEPLVGGNQDRVLSTTILMDGPTDLVVPVTCVEEGRWAISSRRFSSSKYHSYYRSRSTLSRGLSSSLRTTSRYRSDQSGVWREIAFSLGTSRTRSRTHRMSDLFDKHKQAVEQLQAELAPLSKQVGYHASIDRVPVAFELFGSHETFAKYWPKLLSGIAMEAIVSPDIRSKKKSAGPLRKNVIVSALEDSLCETYKSIGKGLDVRITGRRHTGSALLDGDRLEHLVLHWE